MFMVRADAPSEACQEPGTPWGGRPPQPLGRRAQQAPRSPPSCTRPTMVQAQDILQIGTGGKGLAEEVLMVPFLP